MRCLAVVVFLVLGNLNTGALAQDLEILSRDDAREMFSMTKQEWLINVQHAMNIGIARAMGTSETNVGMVMETRDGDLLIVRPSYGDSEKKPDFIQVTVGYRDERASLLSDSALGDMIEITKSQMKPEFTVIGSFERMTSGLSVFFIIAEKIE